MEGIYSYNSPNIAKNIKSRAKQQGVPLKIMLEELSLGSNTMSHMNHGRMIAADSLAKIADYLGCSVDYLLGRTDNPEITPSGSIVNNGSVSGIVGTNAGTINVQGGERVLSDECAELVRIYESLDVRQRIQLLKSAFEIADGTASSQNLE